MVHQSPGTVTPWAEKAEAQQRARGLTQGDQETVPDLYLKLVLQAPGRSSFHNQPRYGSHLTP